MHDQQNITFFNTPQAMLSSLAFVLLLFIPLARTSG